MEITEFTIQIIIIGIPGIFCYFIASKLIGKIGKDNVESFLAIFLFSILSYLFFGLSLSLYNYIFCKSVPNDIIQKIFINQKSVTANDILGATLTSFILAIVLSYLYRFNCLNRFGQKIGATFRYGDEDVWHYFHRAPEIEKNDGWIYVRDHKYNLIYYGYVSVWSESDKSREIILTDVTVYNNNDGAELYSSQHVYLSRNADEISIEVPKQQNISEEKEHGTRKKRDSQ
jgi:hypothetical protein